MLVDINDKTAFLYNIFTGRDNQQIFNATHTNIGLYISDYLLSIKIYFSSIIWHKYQKAYKLKSFMTCSLFLYILKQIFCQL